MGVSFEEWVYAIFQHPANRPEWYWQDDFERLWAKLTYAAMVRYMTRLFQEPELLRHYSLEQVAQGITFLVGDDGPGESSAALFRTEVPLQQRVECIAAMSEFFRRFVAVVAVGETSFDPAYEGEAFERACYMWWDIFPLRFLMDDEEESVEPELEQASLRVMEKVLELPSELCQISALHGLSHWYRHHAEAVDRIVDDFVSRTGELSPRVREYVLQKLV